MAAFTNQTMDNITAHAGGGQTSAVLLGKVINRVTTVAANFDSVQLPTAASGILIYVINAGANSLNVFPSQASGADQINALPVNIAYTLAAGKVALFICTGVGQWHTILTA